MKRDTAPLIQANRLFWENCSYSKFAPASYYAAQSKALHVIAKHYLNKNTTVVDVGCGNGENTKLLSEYCKNITGYELSKNLLQEAKEKNKTSNTEYEYIDLENDLSPLNKPVDAVFCMGVFSTIHSYSCVKNTLAAFNSILSAGGLLVVRESLSTAKTFTCKPTDKNYYAIYRSPVGYISSFIKSGFTLKQTIELSQMETIQNSFYIFEKSADCAPVATK